MDSLCIMVFPAFDVIGVKSFEKSIGSAALIVAPYATVA